MNKRQLEVQKALADNEAEVIKQLKQIYARASKDCENKIRNLSARTDMENLKSIVWQKQYQEALKKQIDGVLDKLNAESFTTLADYLTDCYENGFIGTLYDLQGQGIPLILPINQEEVVQAVQIDSKISKGLYQRMGEDTDRLKKSIRSEVSRGVSNGSSWNTIASKIAFGMNSPFMKAYNRAIGITRTEGHRVQQESTLHCQQRAKEKGADIVKQWDSTLDSVTRPTHRELDGQIREIDEPFEVEGKKAMYPGAFGDPSEDCNCRCCLLQHAKWALSDEEYYTKYDGDKNELVRVEAKNYNEFKEKNKEVQKFSRLPQNAKERFLAQTTNISELPRDIKDFEVSAVRSWTRTDYVNINNYLRKGNRGIRPESIQNAETIKKLIDRNIVINSITVKRYTDFNAMNHLFGNESWRKEDYNVEGKVIKDKGFIATTPDLHGGFSGGIQMYIDIPKGAKGVYLGDVSASPDEKEFLLQCGTQFYVEKIDIWYDKWDTVQYDVYLKVKVGD